MIRLFIIAILIISSCNQTDKKNEVSSPENKETYTTKTTESEIRHDSSLTPKIDTTLKKERSSKKHLDKKLIYKLKLEKIKSNKKLDELEKKLSH